MHVVAHLAAGPTFNPNMRQAGLLSTTAQQHGKQVYFPLQPSNSYQQAGFNQGPKWPQQHGRQGLGRTLGLWGR